MTELIVQVRYTDDADPAIALPLYETQSAAGMDLRANFASEHRASGIVLDPGARALVPTGLMIALPGGFEAQIRPRSGLALKHGISLVNSPGTIDADYRGPIGVIVINHGSDSFQINHGDRIAQIVFAPAIQARWHSVNALDDTLRGASGFGSTGQG